MKIQWNLLQFNEIQRNSMRVNEIQWNSMKLNEIHWNSTRKQCKIVLGVKEIYNKHMIPYNKRMKFDKTKGLKKEGAKMSLHVGRSKSSPPFAGSKKSMFDEQFVKNSKQKKSPIILEKCIPVQWGIQCNQMKSNEIQWKSMKSNEIRRNSMKFNEIHWNSLKLNENHWNLMKFNEIQGENNVKSLSGLRKYTIYIWSLTINVWNSTKQKGWKRREQKCHFTLVAPKVVPPLRGPKNQCLTNNLLRILSKKITDHFGKMYPVQWDIHCIQMKSNQIQWKSMKFEEIQWNLIKFIEIHWKSIKIVEN